MLFSVYQVDLVRINGSNYMKRRPDGSRAIHSVLIHERNTSRFSSAAVASDDRRLRPNDVGGSTRLHYSARCVEFEFTMRLSTCKRYFFMKTAQPNTEKRKVKSQSLH